MPLYDSETFDKSVIPEHYKADVKELIHVAAVVGWKVHVTGSASVTIIAPEERKKYHFGHRSSTPLNRIRRDIVRFGDPAKVMMMSTLSAVPGGSVEEKALLSVLPLLNPSEPAQDDRPKAEPVHTVNAEPTDMVEAGVHVVSEKPMLAKGGEGHGYDSPTTIERRWSDGTRDYKCVSCDYTSPNRGSVPAHHGKSHPLTVKPPTYKADVPDATVYAPRRNRIEALAEVLSDRLASGELPTAEELARLSLMWVHEQTRRGTALSAEAEPMSAEVTLDRIRLLLDDGSTFRLREQMAALEERVIAQTARIEQAEELAMEMEQRALTSERKAEQARQTLKAFTDLATELAAGEQEAG